MGGGRKRRRRADPLEIYRRIRKRMPPPGRVIPDERRKLEEERVRRELQRPDGDGS